MLIVEKQAGWCIQILLIAVAIAFFMNNHDAILWSYMLTIGIISDIATLTVFCLWLYINKRSLDRLQFRNYLIVTLNDILRCRSLKIPPTILMMCQRSISGWIGGSRIKVYVVSKKNQWLKFSRLSRPL